MISVSVYTIPTHHQKFSFHPSPNSWLPLPLLPSPSTLLSWSPLLWSLCLCGFLFFGSSLVCSFIFVFCFFKYSTYEYNHVALVFLCLTYLTYHNTLKIHPCCCRLQDFFFVAFHCIHTPHFFNPSSVNSPLDYFHISTIANNSFYIIAVVNNNNYG